MMTELLTGQAGHSAADDRRGGREGKESIKLAVERPAPIWPSAVLCLTLATLINLGHFHRLVDADAIVPVHTSLYRWTPFYWDTIRFGQLTSLLAMPFRNPLVNLLVQSEFSLFGGLFAFFLMARYLLRGRYWPLTGAAVVLLHLVAAKVLYLRLYLSPGQCFGMSMSLALPGMILLEDFPGLRKAPARFFAAAIFLLLAHWVNSATALLFAPLIALRYLIGRQISFKECAAGFGLNCWAFATMFATSQLVRALEIQIENPLFPFAISSPADWPQKWSGVATSVWQRGGWLLPVLSTIVLITVGTAAVSAAGRKRLWSELKQLSPVLTACAICAILMTSMKWVDPADKWIFRYALHGICLTIVAVMGGCFAAWWPILVRHRSSYSVAAITTWFLIVATLQVYGRPSPTKVRQDIDHVCGTRTGELRAAGCTHLAGAYWRIWPAMFHANLVAYERGESQRMWGVGYRSTELQGRWKDVPAQDFKLAILGDESRWGNQPGILEIHEMKREKLQTIETATPPDIFLIWARGFYDQEGPASSLYHWGRRNTELWVCNRTQSTQQVRLQMQFMRDLGGDARLKISSDWFETERKVGRDQTSLDQTISLLPGYHTIRFSCDGDRIVIPEDIGRWLVFRVLNARATIVLPPEAESVSPPPATSRENDLAAKPRAQSTR